MLGEIPFRYEYKIYSQQDECIAEGEFYHRVYCRSIRSPEVYYQGHFALIHHEHDLFSIYRGDNHVKRVWMKVTNMITKTSRVISE